MQKNQLINIKAIVMRLSRVTAPSILRLLALVLMLLLLSVLYIRDLTVENNPEASIETRNTKPEQHNKAAQYNFAEPKSTKPLLAAVTQQSTTETAPIKYNLMAETYGRNWYKVPMDKYLSPSNCTIEYANTHQLQQDHPCVIRLIRNDYIRPPTSNDLPYKLDHPESIDPSDGQSKAILKILQNKTNGFFVECGGYDGESLSNTLYMERFFGWSGLLIEADKKAYSRLVTRNRRVYASPVCLSTKPYPMQVVYSHNTNFSMMSSILEKKYEQQILDDDMDKRKRQASITDTEDVYKMQCFPLYSILLAVGRTHIDYLGLDVEGSEYKILKTIPWHKVNVQTLSVEWEHTPEGENAITRLMESNKFIKFGLVDLSYSRDAIYVQDFLEDYRLFEDEYRKK